MNPRELVMSEARSWLGTPYHHNARVKGVGVDCGQLLIGVYGACGQMLDMPDPDYPHDWHLHHGEERFLQWLERGGAKPTQEPLPGDIAVWRFGRCFSHGGILVGAGKVIHSYLGLGVVLSDAGDAPLVSRAVQFWAPPWKE